MYTYVYVIKQADNTRKASFLILHTPEAADWKKYHNYKYVLHQGKACSSLGKYLDGIPAPPILGFAVLLTPPHTEILPITEYVGG